MFSCSQGLAGASADVAVAANRALESGIRQANALVAADPCVGELFTHVNPIVVDPGYAGWFSGLIPMEALRLIGVLPREAILANDLGQFRYQVFP